MNLPNSITFIRLILGMVYFIILSFVKRGNLNAEIELIDIAFVIFIVAVISDILDGYVARKLKSVTMLGRILDPLVDKILVCGSLIFFLGINDLYEIYYPWMVIIILAREFLVQGIRVVVESKGIPFGAVFWGKAKTTAQNMMILATLVYLSCFKMFDWAKDILVISIWITLLLTMMSCVVYIALFYRAYGIYDSRDK